MPKRWGREEQRERTWSEKRREGGGGDGQQSGCGKGVGGAGEERHR